MKEGADVTAPRCNEEYEASFVGVRKGAQYDTREFLPTAAEIRAKAK